MEGARLVTWDLNSWQDLAIIIGIVATIAGISGGFIRSRLDRKSAEQATGDRIIRLVQEEAEKRVEVVRTEFALQIAQMELKHRDELESMRADFEEQVAGLKKEHDTYRCEHAPVCSWRFSPKPPPPGGSKLLPVAPRGE